MTLLFCSKMIAQNDSDLSETKIDFYQLEIKQFEPKFDEQEFLKFDFKIIDSSYFNSNLKQSEMISTYQLVDNDYEIKLSNSKIITFECKERIKERCIYSVGYSYHASSYILDKCREVCETYLMSAVDGTIIPLESYYDEGNSVLFNNNYMIVWGSADFYNQKYYDIRSYISVYKILDYDNEPNFEKRFQYVGGFDTKKWSISELYNSYEYNNVFLLKIYDLYNEFDYIEIEFTE